jgi:lysylphosphatidylglycerol synthetase-like protein (DUF2156 family)
MFLAHAARTLAAATTDEKPIGVWFWLILIVEINVTWIAMDIWLGKHHHEFLTTEFKEGLNHPVWGPFIVGLLAFTVAAFLWHMFTNRQGV